MLNQHEHVHSMQIDPNGYDFDTNRQKHRKNAIKQPPAKITNQNKYTSIIVVTANHLLAMPTVTSVETQRYLAFILVLSVEQMDNYPGSVHKFDINSPWPK